MILNQFDIILKSVKDLKELRMQELDLTCAEIVNFGGGRKDRRKWD